MEDKIKASDIKFLALEGGGGKGVTYLGAIEALEELFFGKNDIYLRSISSRLEGISGASAGAITAFFLAMGLSSKELRALLDEKKKNSKTSILDSFTDDWHNLGTRRIRTVKTGTSEEENGACIASWVKNAIKDPDFNFLVEPYVIKLIHTKLLKASYKEKNQILNKLVRSNEFLSEQRQRPFTVGGPSYRELVMGDNRNVFKGFIYNLLRDGGLFTGEKVRTYFEDKIEHFLLHNEVTRSRYNAWRDGKKVQGLTGQKCPEPENFKGITFHQFYYLTGVDLRITGTNITKQISVCFSVVDTPDFPVIEAVGISMNIPIVFKPILVTCNVHKGQDTAYNETYKGLYVDGGMLNNLPLHAFDYWQSGIEFSEPDEVRHVARKEEEDVPSLLRYDPKHLNKHVLALRLSELSKVKKFNLPDYVTDEYEELKYALAYNSYSLPIMKLVGDLLGTLMSPAEESQVRFLSEKEQIVELDTFDLETTDFAPPKKKSDKAIKAAKEKVLGLIS